MCKSCPPCLWEKSWWCCCWVVCSLQCAGVLVVKVYDWQECVSRAKWAFTLSEQGGGMLCEKHVSDFSLWHYRTLCALCCHAPPTPPPTPPIWRSGKESWSCRGWRRRMSRARRRLRGVLVFFCFFFSFSLNQVLSCCVQNHLFSFSMCVNVTWVYFAGVGRQSPWTAAAATAQRSLLPAQRGCVQRASASPPEGAVNRPPANSPRWRWSLQQWRCGAAYSLTL